MITDDVREAARWCRDHLAKVTWTEDETRCRIEVVIDGRATRVWGEGPGFVEAYLACRALVTEYFDDPPTKALERFE